MLWSQHLTSNIYFRITKERFLQLAEEICEIFPTESRHTYYIPSYRNLSGQSVSAHGKLYDRYANLRSKYQSLELIPKKKKKIVSEQSKPVESTYCILNLIIP